MFTTIAACLALAGVTLIGTGVTLNIYQQGYARDKTRETVNKVINNAGIKNFNWNNKTDREFTAYMRDAVSLGYIDKETSNKALNVYNKLRSNNWDLDKLDKWECLDLINMYNSLYNNYPEFKSYWDSTYSNLTDDEKLAFLSGTGGGGGATVPAPAYLDTSFDRYQREVAPLKLYSNKELADLYDLDYDFDSILKDYEAGAQANVEYQQYLSDMLANTGERDNVTNETSYLDSIRNVKSQAINKGISNGARAAAEVLATKAAIENKVATNQNVATQRFELMDDALLNRADAAINATKVYNDLAKNLWSTGATLYANDVNRRGQDLLTNANILSADENLRSNRQAQNNLMAAIYNNVSAQNRQYADAINEPLNYFKNISMPANDYDFNAALDDYIRLAYTQNTGYKDNTVKWGMTYKE